MKWYTLEERPIKEHEYCLFYFKKDFFIYGFSCDIESSRIQEANPGDPKDPYFGRGICCREFYDFDEIKYYSPIEELTATLPKDKE